MRSTRTRRLAAESSTAEKFLRTEDLHHISTAADPLELCSNAGRGERSTWTIWPW